MKTEEKVAKLLLNDGMTVATAESCTGGLLASRLTDVPGSSGFFLAGIVTYSNDAKIRSLGIPKDLLKSKGAVCEDVAILMAKNVRRMNKAHYGIGITGIAGPGGGTKTKPIGLAYIAVATNNEVLCIKCQFDGTRHAIKRKASTQALKLLLEFIE